MCTSEQGVSGSLAAWWGTATSTAHRPKLLAIFRDEPIARMQALSLPMHWSPTWGAHFLYTSSVHNAGGRTLGGEREASGRSGATVPGRSSFCNKAGPGAPRVDMLKSATRLVFHSLPAAGRTPVLVAGTLRFSRCTFVIFRKYLALYQKYLAIPQISGGFVGSYR